MLFDEHAHDEIIVLKIRNPARILAEAGLSDLQNLLISATAVPEIRNSPTGYGVEANSRKRPYNNSNEQ